MITVAIPAYKGKYLKSAIESVLNQTFKDFELIIVNDSSPDDIKNIVNSFNDKRIRYYENEYNYGKDSVVKNWNKCLNLANGEYFVLFADDDYYEPNFLYEMYMLAVKYPDVDILHCKVKIIDENGKVVTFSQSCPEYESAINFIWHRIKGYRLQFVSEFMVKTNTIKNIGGFIEFPLAWSSDDATWFSIASIKNGIVFCDKPLLYWRKSNENISSSGDIYKRLNSVLLFDEWLKLFIKNLKTYNHNDVYLLSEINNYLPERIYILKKKLLMDYIVSFGILSCIVFWLKNRKKFKLNKKLLFSSLLNTRLFK